MFWHQEEEEVTFCTGCKQRHAVKVTTGAVSGVERTDTREIDSNTFVGASMLSNEAI